MRKPLITRETVPSATLDHWLEEFWSVYSTPDLERDLHRTWSMAYEDATRVGEAIRENKPKNCLKYLAHTFCWIASFVAKLKYDLRVHERFKTPGFEYKLSSVVWEKYPGICPKCLEENCICPVLEGEEFLKGTAKERKLALARRNNREKLPDSMDAWGKMFADIYDKAHFIRSLDELGFHLLEEMGEVEEVIRKLATYETLQQPKKPTKKQLQSDLVKEVADTVSWCFSIVRKIAREAQNFQEIEKIYGGEQRTAQGAFITSTLTLSQVLWKEYQRKVKGGKGNIIDTYDEIGCPVCDQRCCIIGDKEEWVLTVKHSPNERSTK